MTKITIKSSRLTTRIKSFISRHAQLESAIRRERARKAPCAFRLQSLKKLRLRVKDDIRALRRPRRAFA